jgi:hypothetical protein
MAVITDPIVTVSPENAPPAYKESIEQIIPTLHISPLTVDGTLVAAKTAIGILFRYNLSPPGCVVQSNRGPSSLLPPTAPQQSKQAAPVDSDDGCSTVSPVYANGTPISTSIRTRKDGAILDGMSCGRVIVPLYWHYSPAVMKLGCEKGKAISAWFSFMYFPAEVTLFNDYDENNHFVKYIKTDSLTESPYGWQKAYLRVAYDNRKPNVTGIF